MVRPLLGRPYVNGTMALFATEMALVTCDLIFDNNIHPNVRAQTVGAPTAHLLTGAPVGALIAICILMWVLLPWPLVREIILPAVGLAVGFIQLTLVSGEA